MVQLELAVFRRPAPLPRAENIRLKESLEVLRAPLAQLQEGYDSVLLCRKQPEANHPDPAKKIEEGEKAFTQALRSLQAILFAQAEKSKNTLAASRVRDGVGSLWTALDRYSATLRRNGATMVEVRDEMAGIFAAVSELRSQQAQL